MKNQGGMEMITHIAVSPHYWRVFGENQIGAAVVFGLLSFMIPPRITCFTDLNLYPTRGDSNNFSFSCRHYVHTIPVQALVRKTTPITPCGAARVL